MVQCSNVLCNKAQYNVANVTTQENAVGKKRAGEKRLVKSNTGALEPRAK